MDIWPLAGNVLTWDEAHVERNQALVSVDGGVWPVGPGQPFTQSTDWVSKRKLEKMDMCLQVLSATLVTHLTDHPTPLTRVGNQTLLGCEQAPSLNKGP